MTETTNPTPVTAADRERLAAHGVDLREAQRQLELLRRGPRPVCLQRPCTPGDGVTVLDSVEAQRLAAAFHGLCSGLSLLKFVPASGAATRMFASLLAALAQRESPSLAELRGLAAKGDEDAAEVLSFAQGVEGLAFYPDLAAALRAAGRDPEADLAAGRYRAFVEFIVGKERLDYASWPKALLPFHRYGDELRTPLEEHLFEAAAYAVTSGGSCHLHFTVSHEHREAVAALLGRAIPVYERRFGLKYHADLSIQKPSTDSIAIDHEGNLFREADGGLFFRQGGHGALLDNLGDLDADLVFIKNIDNVVPEALADTTLFWKKVLGAFLLELRREVFGLLGELREDPVPGPALQRAFRFVRERFNVDTGAVEGSGGQRDWLIDRLDRPLRVCGVVPASGEPGGGPFFVMDSQGGSSVQIVENSQVDHRREDQQAVWGSSTHFNSVDLVCSLRDSRGERFDLSRYVDHETAFLVEKSVGESSLLALEKPGLWNGSMAGWNTVFIEVPLATFNPVKRVTDLLRPQHRVAA